MTEPRIFTLDEAERTLPLVRRIVADIQVEFRAWRDALGEYELAAADARGDAPEPADLEALREAVTRSAARVEELVEELTGLGCELKDFEHGLVDFYSLLDDRLVFLCWRAGEDRITHWHELASGFAGRQPVSESLFPRTVP
jgi:hypothetical protein